MIIYIDMILNASLGMNFYHFPAPKNYPKALLL